MQEKIYKLQDEFAINQAIEDDEARTLMVEAAVKSCQDTLAQLQKKQEKATAEAKQERLRIKAAREKLMSLKGEVLGIDEGNEAETCQGGDEWGSFYDELDGSKEFKGLEMRRDKIKEHFDVGSSASLTVSQMAGKVDELVSKVIDLETAVSSQTAMIQRLRSETDDLQSQIKSLEDDKANLIDGKNTLNDKLSEMELKLKQLQDLNRSFENHNSSLEAHFTEARSSIDTISEKLHNIRPDEEVEEFQKTGGAAEMGVKNGIKGSDTITLVFSQDTRDEKHVELESKALASFPLRTDEDDTQLDEQPITQEQNPSTLDVEEHSRQHQPNISGVVRTQEHPEEYNTSIVEFPQQQEPHQREHKLSTLEAAHQEEHPEEHWPSTFDDVQPQVHLKEYESSTVEVSQQQEPHPREHKPSTFEAAHQEEHLKEHWPSTLDDAQPQVHLKEYEHSTVEVAQQQEPHPREHRPSTIEDGHQEEHPKEHWSSTFDDAQSQEHLKEYEPSTLDVFQQQEWTKEHNPGTAQPQEYPDKKDVEVVNSNETQQRKPGGLSSSFQEPQERETQNMVKDKLNIPSSAKPQEQTRKEEDEPDWQELFMNGLEGKEKVLLAEYTSTLRNYKVAKKKYNEVEKKTQADFSEIAAQLQELRSSNAKKDEEIHALQQKLYLLQKITEENRDSKELKAVESPARYEEQSLPLEDSEDIQVIAKEEEISPVEQNLRGDIDELLEENLDFWMRFSASFSQVQKFQTEVEDLHSEIAKLEKDHEKKEGNGQGSSMNSSIKSDIRPLYKHLREIQTELTVWLEHSEKLRDELERRFSQLCNIEEEIKQALNAGAEDEEMKFTSYQAAKFQGEVANMQQENHKVADELQAGMDHVTGLQLEVDRTLNRLKEELGLGVKSQTENGMNSRSTKVPLRSFIFGAKPQKKKQSIFSFIHPIKHRRYQNQKSERAP